jgi:hypothetical protein
VEEQSLKITILQIGANLSEKNNFNIKFLTQNPMPN